MQRSVYSRPCTTGSIGSLASAYSWARYSASDQKCGGVHTKMMRNSSQASPGACPVTAAQPSTGGMAPEAPPMTMFWGVRGFRITV
jgi:hypothetical protein